MYIYGFRPGQRLTADCGEINFLQDQIYYQGHFLFNRFINWTCHLSLAVNKPKYTNVTKIWLFSHCSMYVLHVCPRDQQCMYHVWKQNP